MAIVSEDDVQAALEYLAIDPHPISLAKKDLVDAENLYEERFAQAFLDAEGSVDARKQSARLDPQCIRAKTFLTNATGRWERHRQRIRSAEMVLEIWRTENANARAAERIR